MPEIRILKYEKLNPHVLDSRLTYDDDKHIYYIDGVKTDISVSGFVHHHFTPFDNRLVISNILNSKKMLDPSYDYYGMNAEQIKAEWEERARLGTILHYDIESIYNDESFDNNSIEFQYFLNFYKDYSYLEVYRTEWRIFSKRANIAGTIDMLFRDVSGDYIIFDWKRSKEIKIPNSNDRFAEYSHTPELSHLTKCNFNEYSIQLNTYKYILETEYGIRVKAMYLCILHPINPNYVLLRVPNISEAINSIMERRIKEFSSI